MEEEKMNSGALIVSPPNDAVMNPIVDRFNAMLKEKDDDEVVNLYQLLLSQLTFNSKPIITDLTIIAGEHQNHADAIADAISARIIQVPAEEKVPSLYLLDSIVKNIGKEYVKHFSGPLSEVYCVTYRQVHPDVRPYLRQLFDTWSTVFPASVLRQIETRLKFSSAAVTLQSSTHSESPTPISESPTPIQYLEASHQLEHSAADGGNHHLKPIASNIEEEKEDSTVIDSSFKKSLPFVEVICKSSGKNRRFAAGTEAKFAVQVINNMLSNNNGSIPLAWCIEAVKEGEESVSFGPNSVLVDYGHGWKLQTVIQVKKVRPRIEEFAKRENQKPSLLGLDDFGSTDKLLLPTITPGYLGKIFIAFVLMFVIGAILTLALENLPAIISHVNNYM